MNQQAEKEEEIRQITQRFPAGRPGLSTRMCIYTPKPTGTLEETVEGHRLEIDHSGLGPKENRLDNSGIILISGFKDAEDMMQQAFDQILLDTENGGLIVAAPTEILNDINGFGMYEDAVFGAPQHYEGRFQTFRGREGDAWREAYNVIETHLIVAAARSYKIEVEKRPNPNKTRYKHAKQAMSELKRILASKGLSHIGNEIEREVRATWDRLWGRYGPADPRKTPVLAGAIRSMSQFVREGGDLGQVDEIREEEGRLTGMHQEAGPIIFGGKETSIGEIEEKTTQGKPAKEIGQAPYTRG